MLKDEILYSKGVSLPISGGYGLNHEDAIIITEAGAMELYDIEDAVLQFLYEKFCCSYMLIKQELIILDGIVYDRFRVSCDYKDDAPDDLELTYVYFNITQCWK